MALSSNLPSRGHILVRIYSGLEFPKSWPAWHLEACSDNTIGFVFPKVFQPRIFEAYSGNIMALTFPEVPQSGIWVT